MRDPLFGDDVAEEDPRQAFREDESVERGELAAEEVADPAARAPEAEHGRAGERERDREEEDPADFSRGQVEERDEEVRNREEDRRAAFLCAAAEDGPEPDRERRDDEEEERGAEVVAELGVAGDGDDADGDRVGGREVFEEEREREEHARRETERRDPEKSRADALDERFATQAARV
jgi:hypothetical protein